MIRLFAAVAIPDDIAGGLIGRQDGIDGASWRPTEAFHITLCFFGEIAENVADDLHSELSIISGEALTLQIEGVGSFQEGSDIQAVWAGVAENPALKRLAARCERAARRTGLKPDRRTWLPHVTLAYLRRPNPLEVAHWVQANNLLKSPPFRVTHFRLYSSWLGDHWSRYQLERVYPLG